MNRFLHNVNLEAHFAESDLSSDDLAYFAPACHPGKEISFYRESKGNRR